MIFRIVIGALVGGGVGFSYYKFIGCASGACPLTSNRFVSTLYGMTLGALIASTIR